METPGRGPSGEPVDTPSHRALASERRVAILRLIRDAADGLTAGQVAVDTGLHLTTARAHLDRLTEAKLLVKTRPSGGVPGRPAWRYRAAAPAPAPASYRGLAAALLENLADAGTDARAAAIRVGRRWGRRLAEAAREGGDAAGAAADADGAGLVVEVLDQLGFAPRRRTSPEDDATELHLPTCPFLELVAVNPETTCALHQGVVHGVLEHAASRPAGEPRPGEEPRPGPAVLDPFGAPDACVVRIPRQHRGEGR